MVSKICQTVADNAPYTENKDKFQETEQGAMSTMCTKLTNKILAAPLSKSSETLHQKSVSQYDVACKLSTHLTLYLVADEG